METCPFCGKAFKRLKSHLPHCKMAGAKNNPSAIEQAKKSPKTGMKKGLLVEAKEQYLKNEGDDTTEMTKKTQPNKKKHKHLESSSCRTPKIMLEEKEKEHIKKDVQNSHLDQAHGNSQLIDKEKNRSDPCPIADPTTLTSLQSPEVATSLMPTDPLLVAVTPSQTSALQALPGGSEFLKASEDTWTWPDRKGDCRGAIKKTGSTDVNSTFYEEVSKKDFLVKDKEQYLKNERNDTILTLPNHKEDLKGSIEKMGSLGIKSPLCDKVSRKDLLVKTTEQNLKNNILRNPGVATSLVPTDPLHETVTPSQTSALQALPGGSGFLEASEENGIWPNRKGDFRGAIEKTGNISIKLPLYEEVLLLEAKEQYLKNEDDTILTLPNHKGDYRDATKKMGNIGIKSPLYKEVSKVMEDRMQREDRCSFGNGFKGSFNEKHFQKTELSSEPSSSFLLSSMVSSSHRPHSGDLVQLPDVSRQLQTHESDELKSIEKTLKGQLDLIPTNETKTSLLRDVLSRNCSLGLQWMPELHSNYIQLNIVPEQIDLKSSNVRRGKFVAPGPLDPESCRPAQCQPIPEVPLTSRRLMEVRIGELPSWLALRKLSLKTVPELGLRAWTGYYNKYINVRKGGIGGLAMLLSGYCILSYAWNYHHIRQDRWRKYH